MKSNLKKFNIGLLSAMPEELGLTTKKLNNLTKKSYGSLEIFSGDFPISKSEEIELKIFAAWSGWGKVNASHAATKLICEAEKQNLNLDFILFTGVAGAACSSLKQWDIVIGETLVQHDMDARPIFEKFVIPGLNLSKMKMNLSLHNWALKSLKENLYEANHFGKVYSGLVATGDKFIDNPQEMKKIKKSFPELKAVEMEGGAVSQIAIIESIPLLLIRVISDNADHSAADSFEKFVVEYNKKSWELIKELLLNIKSLNKINSN